MTARNPAKHKAARAKLDSVFVDAANTWVVHYSRDERPNGAPSRITSISARRQRILVAFLMPPMTQFLCVTRGAFVFLPKKFKNLRTAE